MAAMTQSDARHAALASEPRRRALTLINEAAVPLSVSAVAEALGLHITTARFHLDRLEAAGLVERHVTRGGQRGRPQVRFGSAPAPLPVEMAQQQLTQALAAVIGEDEDGGHARAVRAGERWSAQYAAVADPVSADTPADTRSDAVPPLLGVLTEIGFEPELRADGVTIALAACPFRTEARANPEVVCSVHLGLMKGLAHSLGHDAEGIRLEPFVQPNLCLVHLPATLMP
jgi:predicted ArsR family transcriptional regulator